MDAEAPGAGGAGQPLRVDGGGRFLVTDDGRPFFWLGDTAWALLYLLDPAATEHYLRTRASQGFTVVQCVLLPPDDRVGLPPPERLVPLIDGDPKRPNEAYFDHVDGVLKRAGALGLYLALLPTWGANVQDADPPRFTPESARAYGRFLGRRYRERWNLVWVLGGDRLPGGHEQRWEALAAGLREGHGGGHLMTYHPCGEHSSSEFWHEADWLDFNMIQSGHPLGVFSNNHDLVATDYHKTPVRPTLDGEALYEDMPIGFVPNNGRATGHHVRVNAYWAVFAGALGHTYGHNTVWQMLTPGRRGLFWGRGDWRQALHSDGGQHMGHLRRLMLSRPFLSRIPDQDALDPPPPPGAAHARLTRDGTPGQRDATYLMVYYPYVTWTSRIRTGVIAADRLRGWWYDPRTGRALDIGLLDNDGLFDLSWNTRLDEDRGGPDWVLVLDSATHDYPPPGQDPG